MATQEKTYKDEKSLPNGNWVKHDRYGNRHAVRNAESYGTYKGQAMPPPGRDHIIVLTPNPLPAPKDVDSQ
jgi:hypothetical protein